MITPPVLVSYRPQHISITKIITIGPAKNIVVLGVDSFVVSLVNSFKASASGWETPIGATLLGPFR